jgi:serine phosphatase RsbU (regulator of sigma subunit)
VFTLNAQKSPLLNPAQADRMTTFKGLFINQFTKTVQWPETAPNDTFRIHILNHEGLANILQRISRKTFFGSDSLPIKIYKISKLDSIGNSHILYVNYTSGYRPEDLFSAIGKQATLLVTENYDYGSTMINFLSNNNRIKYELNLAKIESKSLIVDNSVIDNSEKEASEEWQKTILEMRRKLNKEKSINEQQTKKIIDLSNEILQKENTIQEREKYLAKILSDIEKRAKIAQDLQYDLKINEAIVRKKERQIRLNQEELLEQYDKIEDAENQLKKVEKNMNTTLKLYKDQQSFTLISIVFALLITLLFIAAFRNYRKQKSQAVVILKQKKKVEIQRDEIKMQHLQLSDKNKEITDSINYAKRIQEVMFPSIITFTSMLQKSFVFYLPKDIIAGDFYWIEEVGDQVIYAAADCTGHGVPGAIISVFCSSTLYRSVHEYKLTKPSEILYKTLEITLQKFQQSNEMVRDGMDIALCTFNKKTRELQFSGANNPLWIIRKNGKEVEEFKGDKQPIGRHSKHTPFSNSSTVLNEGDCAYVFSDGYSDQFGGSKGKKFKTLNFKKLLLTIHTKSMEEQLKLIRQNHEQWKKGYDQIDDICVIGFKA